MVSWKPCEECGSAFSHKPKCPNGSKSIVRLCPVCGQPLPAGKVRHVPECLAIHEGTRALAAMEHENQWRIGEPTLCGQCGQGWDGITKDHKPRSHNGDVTLICLAHVCTACAADGLKNTRPLVRDGLCATHARAK